MDGEEVRRLSRLIEFNRMRLSQLEDQVARLEDVRQEHTAAAHSLDRFDDADVERAMVPIGAGVQLRIDTSDIESVIVDLGSGIMAERSAAEAKELLAKRDAELADLIEHLAQQHKDAHTLLSDLITQLNIDHTTASSDSPPHSEEDVVIDERTEAKDVDEEKPARRRRRGFGSELTLDD